MATVVLSLTTALLTTASADASLSAGTPAWYSNGVAIGGEAQAEPLLNWGELRFTNEQGEAEVECANLGFGSLWNGGSPARGEGNIMGVSAAGHVPGTRQRARELASTCFTTPVKVGGSYVEFAGWLLDETKLGTSGVKARHITAPWDLEARCGERAETEAPILVVGIPTGAEEATPPACESEAEEISAENTERTEEKGCYAKVSESSGPAPEGCVDFTYVVPGLGIENEYVGTLRAQLLNGVHNGLSPSREVFNSVSGKLVAKGNPTNVVNVSGEVRLGGYRYLSLLTLK